MRWILTLGMKEFPAPGAIVKTVLETIQTDGEAAAMIDDLAPSGNTAGRDAGDFFTPQGGQEVLHFDTVQT